MWQIVLNSLIVLAAFLSMEGVAWFSHKYIMHGFMWDWHKDHHEPHDKSLEKNDLFSVVFSIPSISCFLFGTLYPELNFLIYIGLGILSYGLFYLVFHDIIVHRRVKIKYMAKSAYMRRLIRAHKVHHKTLGKDGASSFGFLIASKKYDE